MGKLLYPATMSLDGFIAGPGGDMSWLAEHLGPNPTADHVIGKIGALLVGSRTFRGDDPYKGVEAKEGRPFGGGWDGPQFVLTRHAPDTPVPDVTFVGDLDSGVAAARAAAVTSTSTSSAPAPPGSASTRVCWTRSSCASRPSCSATASGCSTAGAGPTSSSNASA